MRQASEITEEMKKDPEELGVGSYASQCVITVNQVMLKVINNTVTVKDFIELCNLVRDDNVFIEELRMIYNEDKPSFEDGTFWIGCDDSDDQYYQIPRLIMKMIQGHAIYGLGIPGNGLFRRLFIEGSGKEIKLNEDAVEQLKAAGYVVLGDLDAETADDRELELDFGEFILPL
jgi:hypothetical protein